GDEAGPWDTPDAPSARDPGVGVLWGHGVDPGPSLARQGHMPWGGTPSRISGAGRPASERGHTLSRVLEYTGGNPRPSGPDALAWGWPWGGRALLSELPSSLRRELRSPAAPGPE